MILIGILIAIVAFIFGIPNIGENYKIYVQGSSFILVFGGTLAASFVSSSRRDLIRLFNAIRLYFLPAMFAPHSVLTPKDAVDRLVAIAELAQRKSRQDLVAEGNGVGDGFLERGLNLIGTGLDKEFIRQTLQTDIEEDLNRQASTIRLIRNMGTYAPLFGMAGTVMGIVQVLTNVTDIENIVAGMSLALLTTLYGLILTAIIFMPLAARLRDLSRINRLTKEIIAVGLLAIYDKEIPLKVRKSLTAYLDQSNKNNVS